MRAVSIQAFLVRRILPWYHLRFFFSRCLYSWWFTRQCPFTRVPSARVYAGTQNFSRLPDVGCFCPGLSYFLRRRSFQAVVLVPARCALVLAKSITSQQTMELLTFKDTYSEAGTTADL